MGKLGVAGHVDLCLHCMMGPMGVGMGVGASFVNTAVPYFCELMSSDGTRKPSTMVRQADVAVPAAKSSQAGLPMSSRLGGPVRCLRTAAVRCCSSFWRARRL